MAIGTSTGEEYPSKLEEVLANMDTSGSLKAPLAPRNAPIDELRNDNENPASRPVPTDVRSDVKIAATETTGKNPIEQGRIDLGKKIDEKRNDNEGDWYNPNGLKVIPGQNDQTINDQYPGSIDNPNKWMLRVQAGPNNKDTTPLPDNRPDLYLDENGQQRSRKNDSVLEQFNPFIDKMAKGLSQSDVDLINKYHGFESTHGKWTDEDQKRIQPLLDAVEGQVKHLPSTESTFAPSGQETIEFKNWDGLLFDKVMKHYHTINPGKRSEADLPENARPTAADTSSTWAAMMDSFTNPDSKVPTADKMLKEGSYSKVVDWLENNFKTPGQEMQNWSTKEKLGYMLSTAMGLIGPGRGISAPSAVKPPAFSSVEGASGIKLGMENVSPSTTANSNIPGLGKANSAMTMVERMSADEFMNYLKDRNVELGDPYERALANQKLGKLNPTGDSVEDFIKGSRKSTLRLITDNPPQEPQGRPVPSLQQRQTQEAQRAANDRNYEMGKGTERVNVGQGKGVLNDNKEEVMALISKGHPPSAIAKRFDITPLAVRNWIKRNGKINDISDILKE